jgi:ribosomal protein S18 acetylase RimI-like enzyme
VTEITPAVRVRRATPADEAAIGRILAAAFHDDPAGRWLVPDDARRRRLYPEMFRWYARAYLAHDETHVDASGTGAALWLPEGRELFPDAAAAEAFDEAIAAILGPDAERGFELERIFEAHRPAEPHLHLQLLAVIPEAQGRGIGSALLRAVLERADREGVPAYLEATGERNRALYERHGFVVRGPIPVPGGPTLHGMWREPR